MTGIEIVSAVEKARKALLASTSHEAQQGIKAVGGVRS